MSLGLKRFEEVNQKFGELYRCLESGLSIWSGGELYQEGSEKC